MYVLLACTSSIILQMHNQCSMTASIASSIKFSQLYITRHQQEHHRWSAQGGEKAQDALSCTSLFANEPLIIGLFYAKWPIEMMHLTFDRHPVGQECVVFKWKMDAFLVHAEITGLFWKRALWSVLQMKNGWLLCMSFYGVALLRRIHEITGLFCKRAL